MKTTLSHLLAVVCSVACASSNSVTDPQVYTQLEAADSVKIRVGQSIVVEGTRIRLNQVVNDSRCPSDVVCIWAGDAEAQFSIGINCDACRAPEYLLSLHTTLEPKSGEAMGYRLTLLRVLPEPRSTSVILPGAYAAWVRVVKLPT